MLPIVARAMNWPFWPDADTDCELGIIVTLVNCCEAPLVTVNVAVPVTVFPPPGFV